MIVGHLGRVGAEVNALARANKEMLLRDGKDQLRSITKRIVALQRDIMKGMDHAGEKDR